MKEVIGYVLLVLKPLAHTLAFETLDVINVHIVSLIFISSQASEKVLGRLLDEAQQLGLLLLLPMPLSYIYTTIRKIT